MSVGAAQNLKAKKSENRKQLSVFNIRENQENRVFSERFDSIRNDAVSLIHVLLVSKQKQEKVEKVEKNVSKKKNIQKQSSGGILSKSYSYKLCKIHKKTPVPESLFQ